MSPSTRLGGGERGTSSTLGDLSHSRARESVAMYAEMGGWGYGKNRGRGHKNIIF